MNKKQLKEENEWLWYNHVDILDEAETVITKQYNKKGKLIAMTDSLLPPKKHRVKPPKHLLNDER